MTNERLHIQKVNIVADDHDRFMLKALTHATVSRFGKKILYTRVINGREWQYHATKGWRSRRA